MYPKSLVYRLMAGVLVAIIVSSMFIPMFTLADPPASSLDIDGDGLSNELETSGWYSLAGGPYITDPLDFDSDDDGLSDGEEKLYGTIPVNGPADSNGSQSPGIYIRYDNSLETKQYFSPDDEMETDEWGNSIRKYLPVLQGGSKYLMTEAMVVRRGATFKVSAPKGATVSVTGSGLTALTPVQDACSNDWTIDVPLNGTVGTYNINASLGGWSESIPLHVIFDFPADLTAEEIDAYIYDDDPDNKRDEVSVWYRTPDWSYYYVPPLDWTEQKNPPDPPVDCADFPNSPCSDWQYHHSYGYAQAFWTEQFTQKVFINHTMPTIHGQTNKTNIVNSIANHADKEFRVVYVNTHNNWSDAMYKVEENGQYTMDGGACQDNANIFTTILRSAGLPAKTFLGDYNKTAGHGEGGQIGSIYEYDHSVLIWLDGKWKGARSYAGNEAHDTYYPFVRGIKPVTNLFWFYGDDRMDLMITSDERWDWQDGTNGGGMVNTEWGGQGEGIPLAEFEYPNTNWDIDWNSRKPLEIIRSPYAVILNEETWKGDNWAPSEWRNPPTSLPAGRVATQTYVLPAGIPSVAEPLENWPYNPVVAKCSPSAYVNNDINGTPEADCAAVLGTSGDPTPTLVQDQAEINGNLLIAPNSHLSYDAQFSGDFSHVGVDKDKDGKFEKLNIQAPLDISVPGMFKVEGVLYDAQDNYIGQATWTGTGPKVTLQFDIANANPPYTLERLRLFAEDGSFQDSRHYQAYKIDDLGNKVDQGNIAIPDMNNGNILTTLGLTTTSVIVAETRDTNGNGDYDELVVEIAVQSDQSGNYRVEGLLADANGRPVAWAVSQSQAVGVGSDTLELVFDGRLIRNNMYPSASPQTLNLVGLKIFSGNLSPASLEDELPVALTTSAYDRDDFENYSVTILEDDMENGTGNWSWSSPWTLNSAVASSPDHAWLASGDTTGTLTSLPLDLSELAEADLRFNVCYDMGPNDVGHLEVSTNGVDWTPAMTYTNATQPWEAEYLDLDSYAGSSNLEIRFNAAPANPIEWYIDDVTLAGFPGISNVSFTYSPSIVIVDQTVTFSATYFVSDPTLPITFTWDFGDGSAQVVTTSTTVNHTFSENDDHTVVLTVESPYDSVSTSQIVGSHIPVSGTAFDFAPTVPEVGTSVAFSAVYTPGGVGGADTPITYTWDFGDGSIQSTTNNVINHSFSTGGNYVVKLTTSNGYGTAIHNEIVAVKQGVSSVSIEVSPAVPQQDELATYTANILPNTASQPVTYTWNFGGGIISTTTTPSIDHAYASLGNKTVWITADNGYGTPAIGNKAVYIDGIPVDTAWFDASMQDLNNDRSVTFSAFYNPINATQPMTYTWDYGNGTISSTNASSITYPYATDNTYTVSLTIDNGYGSPAVYTDSIVVPLDTDGDGLSDVEEITIYNTNPNDPDSDVDNRTDYEEVMGYIYTHTVSTQVYTNHIDFGQLITTDPNDFDSDDDGMQDGTEFIVGTHPGDMDTDDDGLFDGLEQDNGSTNPLDPDSDDDTLLDGSEVITVGTNPLNNDSDSDFIHDNYEVGPDLNNPFDTDVDTIINALDIDDDNDAISTTHEHPDDNNDGNPADALDSDNDTIPDYLDDDDDNDGILTTDEDIDGDGDPTNDDSDNDTIPDYLDDDDDNDGILTADEDANGDGDPTNDDSDGDGLPDYRDDDNAPIAIDDSYNGIDEGSVFSILLITGVITNDIDVDHDPLTATLILGPVNGNLNLAGSGAFTYTHNGSETVTDTFTYQVTDGINVSNAATVTLNINPVNDAPTAVADAYQVDEGGTLIKDAQNGVLANDTDPENDQLFASVIDQPVNGTITEFNADGSFTYVHDGSETISDSFTYKVNDGALDGNTTTVSIVVSGVNNPPQAIDDAYSVDEGGSLIVLAVTGVLTNDTDAEDNPLTATLQTDVSHGNLTFNSDGSFTYVHDGSETITDTFTYQASDGPNNSNVATVTININQVNDPPTAVADAYQVNEGGTLIKDAQDGVLNNDTDPENDQLFASVIDQPVNGTITEFNADGSFTYVHDGSETISDSFTYQVNDGSLDGNIATVDIVISGVNEAPQAMDDSYSVDEGALLTVLVATGVLTNDTDVEGNPLTATLQTDVAHGSLTFNSDGSFSYTHDGSETLTDTFTYQASDGNSNSNMAQVVITISPVNDAPVATSDAHASYNVEQGSTLTATISVLDNDTDEEGDTLSAEEVDPPANGTLTLNADGTFVYTHDGSETTSDSFTYRAFDGEDYSNVVTVSISIYPEGVPPLRYIFLPLVMR